jgi:uncharacterized protein (TIGR01244 family)
MVEQRFIDDRITVAPQIAPEDVPALAAAGFTLIVNNRPDGEEPGQPSGAAIAAAAAAAGLDYRAIPVDHRGISGEQVGAMAEALDRPGPVLAFCRSGTRSCHLWALAAASRGEAPETLVARAHAAGYDLSGLAPALNRLSRGE